MAGRAKGPAGYVAEQGTRPEASGWDWQMRWPLLSAWVETRLDWSWVPPFVPAAADSKGHLKASAVVAAAGGDGAAADVAEAAGADGDDPNAVTDSSRALPTWTHWAGQWTLHYVLLNVLLCVQAKAEVSSLRRASVRYETVGETLADEATSVATSAVGKAP